MNYYEKIKELSVQLENELNEKSNRDFNDQFNCFVLHSHSLNTYFINVTLTTNQYKNNYAINCSNYSFFLRDTPSNFSLPNSYMIVINRYINYLKNIKSNNLLDR